MRGASAAFALLIVLAALPPGAAESPATLTLFAPQYVPAGATFEVNGTLRQSGLGLPLQTIDILLDGELAGKVATNSAGTYRATLVAPAARGPIALQARWLAGQPVEEASAIRIAFAANAPSQPFDLSARDNASRAAADLSWRAPSDDGGAPVTYLVQRRDAITGWTMVGSSAPLSFSDATAPPGRVSEFRVLARNDVGTSEPSASASTLLRPPALATPGVSYNVLTRQAMITWSVPAGLEPLTGFVVIADGEIADLPPPSRTSFVEPVGPSIRRTYAVAAVNAEGEGPLSPLRTLVTPPAAPAAFTATGDPVFRQIALAWSAPGETGPVPTTGYRIERREAGPWTLLATTNASTFTLVDSAVQWSTSYEYRVLATNEGGAGPWTYAGGRTPDVRLEVRVPRLQACVTEPVKCVWASPGDTVRYDRDTEEVRFDPQVRVVATRQDGGVAGDFPALLKARASWPGGGDPERARTVYVAPTGTADWLAFDLAQWDDLPDLACRMVTFDVSAEFGGVVAHGQASWNICHDF